MKLTKNFDSTEFACKCGKCDGNVTIEFARKMQLLRDTCGHKLPITSGYRCAEHNKKVGGALDSRHIYGDAADISTAAFTGRQYCELIGHALDCGFTGIGLGVGFIHVDTRAGDVVVWHYPAGKTSGGVKQ